MPKLTIDGIEIEVAPGTSVLQACEQLGIEIPRFCYHDRLSVPANCRMCLVEMERAPKPVASCAMPCADGMVIKTDSETAKKARKGVMEFLLINHPLDCPICDQGGECDLQDQAVAYGMDQGRYKEGKRAVTDKYMGPLIRTVMTRCIQCTRCIRFAREIAGVPDLGAVGRGEHMEITTYVDKAVASELSGNLVDVCPVGALTSAPYAFTARPWELKKTESIDVTDAVGSNIRIDARGGEVLRVLPRLNEDVNEEWISDKTRYVVDGLKRRRLDRPYVRKNGKLTPVSWDEAFQAVADKLSGLDGSKIAALAGDQADVETMVAYKDLLTALGSDNLDCRQDGGRFDAAVRAGYLFNTGIAGIEKADAILLIGTDPRREAAIINARIRKRYLQGGVKIAVIGEKADLTYAYEHIGTDGGALLQVASGQHPFVQVLKTAKNPMLILGAGVFTRPDGAALQKVARNIAADNNMIRDDWNGFNVLHTAAARVGGLDVGFLPGAQGRDTAGILAAAQSGAVSAVFLLAADEIDMSKLGSAFVVYQGHHGDKGASRADVILPGAAYTEKNATFVNTEGRPQLTRLAVFPPGEAKEDWKIVRALSGVLGKTLPYDSLAQLRARIAGQWRHLSAVGEVAAAAWGEFGVAGAVSEGQAFVSPVANFYMTDPVSRASATMARCTETFLGGAEGASAQARTGTHG